MRLKSSGEFSLEGYRSALGIPQLVRLQCFDRHSNFSELQGF